MVLATENLKEEILFLLRNDAELFDFVQNEALEGFWFLKAGKNGRVYINPKLQSVLGYKELSGNIAAEDLFYEPGLQRLLHDSTSEAEQEQSAEIFLLNSRRETRRFELRTRTLSEENGKTRILGCLTRALDNKRPEKSQLRKIQRYEQIIEGTNIGTWEWNLQTGQVIFNEQWAQTLGYSLEELQPVSQTSWSRLAHPEDMEKCQVLLDEHIAGQTPSYVSEARMKHKNGNWVWVLDRGKVVSWTIDGKPEWMTGYHEEITRRKKIVERQKLFIDQAPSALAMLDNKMNYLAASQKWLSDYDLTGTEIIGRSHYEVLPEMGETWEKIYRECLGGAVRKKEEDLLIRRDGGEMWISWEVRPWYKNDNRIGGLLMHSVDITQRKEAEREKKEKENLLQTILDKIDVGIISCDQNGKLTLFNRATREWHGLPPVDIPQEELTQHYGLYKPDGITPLKMHEIPLLKALREGSVDNDEMLIKPQNGKARLITVTGSQLKKSNGEVAGAVVALHDITQRKSAEEQLRISEEAFRGNFENAAVGMAILTPRGQWLEVNKSLCSMLGYSPEELKELTFQEITHQEDLRKDLLLLKELLGGKREFYVMEKRYNRKDGQLVYALLYISLVRDSQNEPLHLIAQITDVTAQKVAEQKLVETLSRLEGLLEASTQVSIIGTDTEGEITVFNRGAENLLGYCRDEVLLKKSLLDLHLKEEIKRTAQEISRKEKKQGFEVLAALAGKDKFDTREWCYVRKDGSKLSVQVTLTAIKESGELKGYLAVAADISEIKKAEKEVKSLLDVTKDQNDRLKNFAHIVSHNLRSHSGNLAMLLDLYIQENPEAEENEMIRHLVTASQNLKETITHLNEVVLINTSVGDNLLSLNLTENVDQAIRNVTALAEEADVKIINEISPEVTILGLPAYLDSILLNFLTNGIKYSSPERDSYIRLSTTKGRKYIILNIEDNGLGIDLKKYKSKLFGMYKTFHAHKDARGIGLFITKNQIEAIGGKIEVESEVNKGTTFKIYLKHEKN